MLPRLLLIFKEQNSRNLQDSFTFLKQIPATSRIFCIFKRHQGAPTLCPTSKKKTQSTPKIVSYFEKRKTQGTLKISSYPRKKRHPKAFKIFSQLKKTLGVSKIGQFLKKALMTPKILSIFKKTHQVLPRLFRILKERRILETVKSLLYS